MTKYRYKSVAAAVVVGVILVGSPAVATPPTDRRPLTSALLVQSEVTRAYHRAAPPIDIWEDIPPTNFGPCGLSTAPEGGPTRTHLAAVGFLKSPANTTTLEEILAVVGDRNARAAVAATRSAWRDCPTTELVTADGTHQIVQAHPMAVPRLGAASSGLRYVVRLRSTGAIVLYTKLIMVAYHGVLAQVFLFGPGDPDRRELIRLATRAVAKLQRIR